MLFVIILLIALIAVIITIDTKLVLSSFDNVWDNKYLNQMLSLVEITEEVLQEHDITNFVYCGTLLGAKRHKGPIPWDDDVDMAVFTDESTLDKLKSEFAERGVGLVKYKHWYKTYFLNNPSIGLYDWSWPFVDLFLSTKEGDNVIIKQDDRDVIIKQDDTFPIQHVPFNKILVNAPKNIDVHLTELYGDNHLTECVSSSWNHRYEKGIFMTYSIKCANL